MAAKTSLRLMPLGGSVTYGVGSSHSNGYRNYLTDLLLADHYDIHILGSRKSGSMSNNDNEGWRDYRLDQIESKARKSIQKFRPTIFTLNVGSNDCIQNFQLDTFDERMGNMLEHFWQICPLSTVILSTLLVNADKEVNLRVLRLNDQLRNLVELKMARKKRIVLADMHSSQGPQLEDLVDGTHPGDEGYNKMGFIWFDAIQKAQTECLLI